MGVPGDDEGAARATIFPESASLVFPGVSRTMSGSQPEEGGLPTLASSMLSSTYNR